MRRIEMEEATCGGEYLPLSVCAQRGFDLSLIQQFETDKEYHAYLGTCYRVQIRAVFAKAIEQFMREELLKSKHRLADKRKAHGGKVKNAQGEAEKG